MDIIKLPAGECAPEDTDCVHIEKTLEGKYQITCSALLACGDGNEVESIAVIGSDLYDSYDQAEAAGMAWAADQCVAQLYISTS